MLHAECSGVLKIQFLGGASEVGRSAILLKGDKNIMLDYGLKVNSKQEYPLNPGKVAAIILSHAHLDHCGSIPILYNYALPVTFGTPPTQDLSRLLIEDSLQLSRKLHTKAKYTKRQVFSFINKYAAYDYGQQIEFDNKNITFYDAGHIAGSAVTLLENANSGRRIVYTGDFKLHPQFLQGSAEIVESDTLIIESTYATRKHPDREKLIEQFVEDVKATVESGGIALIPSFAVGRAQEIVSILYKNNLIDNTFIDGMAKAATDIVLRYPKFSKNKNILVSAMKNIQWIDSTKSRNLALQQSSIIVTTAGMLNGGPVLYYIERLNKNSKIFLTGYQVEGTNGRRLLEGKPILIDGRKFAVKTPFTFYDFSAHADSEDLHQYVKGSNPEKVICVHGDSDAAQTFAETLKIEGFDAQAPKIGEEISVDF